MFLEWSEQLEIGDPVVDSEHRYLIQLIVNLHEQYNRDNLSSSLAHVFTHLAMYVKIHFENEEKLMEAIGYPDLEEHRKLHQDLVEQAVELSEQYMDGSETITVETINFLKKWAISHIIDSDMKIRHFLKGRRPPELNTVPAFAIRSGAEFKKCSFCGKIWKTFYNLIADDDILLKGCQLDMTNHLYNLIMFNCSCDTTLAMFLKEFITQTDIPFVINEHEDINHRPEYCLKKNNSICLERCACAYTSQILSAIGNGQHGEIVE